MWRSGGGGTVRLRTALRTVAMEADAIDLATHPTPTGQPPVDFYGAAVFPRHSDETRNVRPALVVLIVASFVLLAVACGNVAAILLGSGIERERELAVRGALGAGRGRIAQQLLTESVVIAAPRRGRRRAR